GEVKAARVARGSPERLSTPGGPFRGSLLSALDDKRDPEFEQYHQHNWSDQNLGVHLTRRQRLVGRNRPHREHDQYQQEQNNQDRGWQRRRHAELERDDLLDPIVRYVKRFDA